MEEIKTRVWEKEPLHVEGNGLPVVSVDIKEVHLAEEKGEPILALVMGKTNAPHTLLSRISIRLLNATLHKLGYVITCPPKHLVRHTEYSQGVRSKVLSEHLYDTDQEAKDACNSYNVNYNHDEAKSGALYVIAEYIGEVAGTYKPFRHVPESV